MTKKQNKILSASFDNSYQQLDIYNNWIDYTKEIIVEENWVGHSKTAAYVITHFDSDVTIADIGCGTGVTGAILMLSGYKNIDGYDIVDKYINHSKIFYKNVEYCDILESSLPRKYDIILASGIFNYSCLSSKPAKHIYNSLNKNGLFVMINPAIYKNPKLAKKVKDTDYLRYSGWKDQEYFEFIETIGPYKSRMSQGEQFFHETNILKPINLKKNN